ncbi:MAG TPA: DUF4339 domain-containing protein, partial [Rariglobus sp.]
MTTGVALSCPKCKRALDSSCWVDDAGGACACYFIASGGGRRFARGMQWYYSIDGQRLGPVPHAELERLIQAGTITGDALIWRQGMDQW